MELAAQRQVGRTRDARPGPSERADDTASPAPLAVVAVPGLLAGAARIDERALGASVESSAGAPSTRRPDHPQGLPPALRRGIESLSGLAMDDVRVIRDSPRPAALRARAYTQGSEIHLGPGQERHLPHEAWHVVQQKQGRVSGGPQAAGTRLLNEDPALEREADTMGNLAGRSGQDAEPVDDLATVAPSAAIQLMKVGIEITFSHPDLHPMSLSEKAYKSFCKQQKVQEPESFDHYTTKIRRRYFKPWMKFVEQAEGQAPRPTSVEDGDSPKGSPFDLNTVFTYQLERPAEPSAAVVREPSTPVDKAPVSIPPVPSGPVVSVVPVVDQMTDALPNPMKQEVGEPVSAISATPKVTAVEPPEQWWWDIDIDPACLEIRAMPIDHTLYQHPVVRSIIHEHIYGGAKHLGLQTGYAGFGGGHISVDLATGFDSAPINVIKTLAWVELTKHLIDKDVALIDVIDNKNAPYLFHVGRGQTGLGALRDWLLASLREPKLLSPDRPPGQPLAQPPAQPPSRKKPSRADQDRMNEQVRQADLKGVPWNDHLAGLGLILGKFLAVDPQDPVASQNPGMFADLDDFERLHYLAVNLQHTRTADRDGMPRNDKTLKESGRRVEFRRLVSQRNVDELIAMIGQVVGWIEAAKLYVPDVLAKQLETCEKDVLVQSDELIKASVTAARKVEKQDRKR